MRKNSIEKNSIGLQEFAENDDDSHIVETPIGKAQKSVITYKREQVYVENFEKLHRKTTIEVVTKFLLEDNESNKKDNIKVVHETEEHIDSYELREILKEKLNILRNRNIPIFILKENDRYYFAFVPYDFKLTGAIKVEHRCAPRTSLCKRLSPKPDCEGGCRKVRTTKKRLEQFSWIKSGYETINTEFECFVVIKCEHQELIEETNKYEKVPGDMLLELSSFLWNDVDSVEQLIKRINRNVSKN